MEPPLEPRGTTTVPVIGQLQVVSGYWTRIRRNDNNADVAWRKPSTKVLLLGLVIALVGAGCSSTETQSVGPVEAEPLTGTQGSTGSGDSATTFEADGAKLVVPTGLAEGRVEVVGQPRPVDEAMRASALSGPVSFELEGDWSGAVEVRIPLRPEAIDAAVVLLHFEEPLGIWVPVPDSWVDTDTGEVVGIVDHLSWYDAIVDTAGDVGSAISGGASWVNYQTQDVFGNRADQPKCSSDQPDWVKNLVVNDERNATLLACIESAPGDRLRVVIGVNRGFSVSLTANQPIVSQKTSSLDIDGLIGRTFSRAMGNQEPGAAFGLAGQQIELTFDKPTNAAFIEIAPSVDAYSILGDALGKALSSTELAESTMLPIFECAVAVIDTSNGSSALDTAREAVAALPDCAKPVLEAMGGAMSTSFERFLIAFDIWDLAGTSAEAIQDSNWEPSPVFISVRINPDGPKGSDAVGRPDCSASATISLTATTVNGLSLEDGALAIVDCLNAVLEEQGEPRRVPLDSFWGPFSQGCFDYVDWTAFLLSTCDDQTAAGWFVTLPPPPPMFFDYDELGDLNDLNTIAGWPADTSAFHRIDVERWLLQSEQLGLSAVVDDVGFGAAPNSEPALASTVFPESTRVLGVWTSSGSLRSPAITAGTASDGTLNSFVPAGFELLASETGDLNGDDFEDAVLVLRRSNEGRLSQNPRPALVLLGVGSGRYQLAARSDSVAMCAGCGGVLGDPFQGLAIGDRYFSFEHFGGSRETWFRVITFRLDLDSGVWELTSDRSEIVDRLDPNQATSEQVNSGNDGADFTTYDYANW